MIHTLVVVWRKQENALFYTKKSKLPMVLIRSPFSLDLEMNTLLKEISKVFEAEVDLSKASLIDTYRYKENGLTYKQFVYRLPDRSIYVKTELVDDEELSSLQKKLDRAVKNQNFEEAAKIRDEIKARSEKE
jgi:excinuclease UvrABC helicase subunit UvrB